MTAMLTTTQTQVAPSLVVTFELVGLETYEREPGSDEWDDTLAGIADTVSAAFDVEIAAARLTRRT
jgi:hypothetical protein